MGKPDGKGGGQAAADPRFTAMHSDPRFQRFPKQKNKVVVDKRFAGMFEDPEFQNRSAVDKRGRKIEARRRNEDLRRYYRLKDEEEWRQEGGAEGEQAAPTAPGGTDAKAPKPQQISKQPSQPLEKQQRAESGPKGKAVAAAAGPVKEGRNQKQKQHQKQQDGAPGVAAGKDAGPRRGADQGAVTAQRKAQGGKSNGHCKGKEPASQQKEQEEEEEEEEEAEAAVLRKGKAKVQRTAEQEKARSGAGAKKPAAAAAAAAATAGKGQKRPPQRDAGIGAGSGSSSDGEDEESSGSGDEDLDEGGRGLGSDDEDGDLEEEEEEEEDSDKGAEGTEEADEEDEEAARARERWARARGMLVSDSSDSSDEEGEQGEDEYDSADEPLTDEEYESDEQLDSEEWGAGAHALNPEEPIPEQEETRRLALVDLDWDHVKAVDVLAALRSFLPRGAAIERVTVYPSDYGLQRMAEEEAVGPRLILKPNQRNVEAGDKDGGGAAAATSAAGGNPAGKKPRGGAAADGGGGDDDGGAEVDKRRLAAYEKSRLRYYYAIVECDCVATALQIYNECDGMEFERSACKFDLRFVPDEQSFEDRQVRDSATEVPPGYQPPAQFNISLQHTDPRLSWDAEDPERKRKLQGRRLKTDEELLEADFAAYLGSEEEEDEEEEEEEQAEDQEGAPAARGAEGQQQQQQHQQQGGQGTLVGAGARKGAKGRGGKEDAEALRRRYRALLLGDTAADADGGGAKSKGRVGGKSWLGSEDGEEDVAEGQGEAEEEARRAGERRRGGGEPSTSGRGGARKGDMDMVVTFHSGLEGLGERLKKKKEEERARAGETVWEAYLRKKREKRAQRKAQGRLRNLSDSEDSDDYISDGEDDGGAKGKGRGKDAASGRAKEQAGRKGGGGGGGDGDDMYGDVPSDDPFFQHNDGEDPFADPFFNQDGDEGGGAGTGEGDGATRKEKKGKREKQASGKGGDAAAVADKADLELLLMDDAALREAARGVKSRVLPAGHDDAGAAGGKRKLTKKEKRDLKKEARRLARAGSDEDDAAGGGAEDAQGFSINLDDPRFAAMFRSAEFALDPTDPRFKKMQARDKLLTEVKKRRVEQEPGDRRKDRPQNGAAATGAPVDEAQEGHEAPSGGGRDLRIMVAKLKRKAEAQHEKQRAQALGKEPKKARL